MTDMIGRSVQPDIAADPQGDEGMIGKQWILININIVPFNKLSYFKYASLRLKCYRQMLKELFVT